MDHPINHISLCAGYAGIDLGLRRVLPTCRTISYVEIEAFACANLANKMEEGALCPAPIWTDLHTFPFLKFRGLVDILSGGFPCQPFSAAGSRLGVEDKRHLWPRIVEGIRDCRPSVVFFENVDGISTAKSPGFQSVLHNVLCDLEGLGYRATADLYTAEELGAPHVRKRWFILGVSDLERELPNADDDDGQVPNEVHPGNDAFRTEPDRRGPVADTNSAHCKGGGVPGGIHKKHHHSHGSGPASGELADSNRCRSWESLEPTEPRPEGIVEPSCDTRPLQSSTIEQVTRWPAGPGPFQHDWEVQRTTQPGLGGAAHGGSPRVDETLNRVDRLRLLGNGVVPDQAAMAFVSMMDELLGSPVS